MKRNLRFKSCLQFLWILILAPIASEAQCEIFKSEMNSVKKYITEVSQLTDSLKTYAETAAFAAHTNTARSNARSVELLSGLAVNSVYEAASRASEAQYYSEVCGIKDVKSYAIEAESFTIDARDFADVAYANAKKANTAKNLGDIRYYMRKSLNASIEAQNAADAAAYAASNAYYSCTHKDAHATGSDK